MKISLRQITEEWRERDRVRLENWITTQTNNSNVERVEGTDNGRIQNGDENQVMERVESVRERRTELTFRLINIQGLSEAKLRELEDVFFGDIKHKTVRHVILCLTETQQKMRKFRERPDHSYR